MHLLVTGNGMQLPLTGEQEYFIGRKDPHRSVLDQAELTPVMTTTPANTSFAAIKRQTLEDQRQALLEEYQAANGQLARTLSDVDRVRLERQLRDLEQKIAKIEANLAALDQPPEVAGEVPNDDSAPGQAGASPADSGEKSSGDMADAPPPSPPAPPGPVEDDPPRLPQRAPIWIWYFVVVLLGFVLGVVTDLMDLLGLSRCTGLSLAAALALISGLAILGFSWLPEQRKLHSQKDRIILVVLTLVVTVGLAIYASISCSPPPSSVVVALKTSHGTNVTTLNAEDDWKLWGWTDYPSVTDPERFTLMCIDADKVALLTHYDRYVTAMDTQGDWLLRAGRPVTETRGASELFTLLNAQTGKPRPCSKVVEQLMQSEVSVVFLTAHCPIDAQNGVSQVSLAEQCRHVTARNGKDDDDWRIWADEPGPIRDEQIFTVIKQN